MTVDPARTIKPFSLVAATFIGAVDAKPTNHCFTDPHWVHRDGDWDLWLPSHQPKTDPCIAATLTFSEDKTFIERALDLLRPGWTVRPDLLGRFLIERGYVLTAAQVDRMVADARRGGWETGVGKQNLCFVRTKRDRGPVAVGYFDRDGRDWFTKIYPLDHSLRWYGHIPLHIPLHAVFSEIEWPRLVR